MRKARYNITNNPRIKHDITIYWDDATYRAHDQALRELQSMDQMINYNFTDNSKEAVEQSFSRVFQRSMQVDPATYEGLCVKKGNINASHDGEILQCPCDDKEKGYVYQILIDNAVDKNTFVEDLRIPVINYQIPFVYLKYKRIDKRFGTFKSSGSKRKKPKIVHNPLKVLKEHEIEKIIAFCKDLKMEYGELDVLRNRDDGEIYIIDANNTPHGPSGFTTEEKSNAINLMKDMFLDSFRKN